jgi:hypothetical protein
MEDSRPGDRIEAALGRESNRGKQKADDDLTTQMGHFGLSREKEAAGVRR